MSRPGERADAGHCEWGGWRVWMNALQLPQSSRLQRLRLLGVLGARCLEGSMQHK